MESFLASQFGAPLKGPWNLQGSPGAGGAGAAFDLKLETGGRGEALYSLGGPGAQC